MIKFIRAFVSAIICAALYLNTHWSVTLFAMFVVIQLEVMWVLAVGTALKLIKDEIKDKTND